LANNILVRVKLKFGSLEDIFILNASEQDVIIDDDLGWISVSMTHFDDMHLDLKINSSYMEKNEVTRYQMNISEMKTPTSDWLTDPKDLLLISNFAQPLSLHSKISVISQKWTIIEVTRLLKAILFKNGIIFVTEQERVSHIGLTQADIFDLCRPPER